MSDTRIHPGISTIHSQEFPRSIGNLGGRSVGFDPKWKPLFVVFIILGMIGLGAAACGVAGIGSQHHWWSAGLINHLNQTQSLIFLVVGGVGGAGFLAFGIVGIAKMRKEQQHAFHSSSSDFTTHNPTTQVSTFSSPVVEHLDSDNIIVSEQYLPNSQNTNHSENSRAASAKKIKQEKKETTNRTGQICITTQMLGGYIGHPSKRQLLPHYLADITLEDGSPLPLDDEDFFCELHLFNGSRQLEKTDIPSTMYLPGALFRGKKDGDTIRLRYKEKLIELTIEQQNHGLKFAKGTFEDVFAMQAFYIKETCDPINPLFSIYDPYWFYRLGDNGVLYKMEIDKSEKDQTVSHLKDGTSEDFRPQVNPARALGDILIADDDSELIFVIEFCRFEPQDFDIVLNETHLIVYGRFEDRCQMNIEHIDGNRDEWQKALSSSREAMYACRWDKMECFNDLSLEEMKAIMKKSVLILSNGILQLHIPLKS